MKSNTNIRDQIVHRIKRIPEEKLLELNEFVSKLERKASSKEKILSFAGSWSDIDEDLFEEFTNHLHSKRRKNIRKEIE